MLLFAPALLPKLCALRYDPSRSWFVKGRMMHDVVIIGGGHNGLVCSAYLAMAGLKVLVLDSDSRTDRGRAIDTRVQSELVSSIVPRGTSLRWIVAPTVWSSSLRLSAPFPLSSGTRFHHSTCDA